MKAHLMKVLRVFALVLFISIGIPVAAFSQDSVASPVSFSASSGVYSKYVWRGFLLDDDPVLQSGVSGSAYGITGTVWGSMDMANDDELASDEVDYIIDYTYSADSYSLSVGHTYYDFPGYDGSSKEFYVGAGMNVFLSPKLVWYRDYGDEEDGGGDGDYAVMNVSHSLALPNSSMTVDLAGHAGYNDGLFLDGTGWDIGLSAGLGIPLSSKCELAPSVAVSVPYGDLEDEELGNQETEVFAGVLLTFEM
jgi:hypothetical protein